MKAQTVLQREVEQRIGRNLLRYQLVEARLKQALPLRSVSLSKDGFAALTREIERNKKQSLGMLMPGFIAAFEDLRPDDAAAFRSSLEDFVERRNWLVHHLLVDSQMLTTLDACRDCVESLDRDYDSSEAIARAVHDLHQFVVVSLTSFLDFWCEAGPRSAGVAEASRRQGEYLANLYGGNVSVELQLPLLEVLSEIMGAIEATNARSDGWVPFNPVGLSMHRRFPDVPPRLLSMAKQLEHYEFDERPSKPGTGSTWMYRRRVSST